MKKFSVLIALALLAVAGTGYAVTCAYDNVPAATLLVPHFRVARNGSTGGDIPDGGVDTLCAVTNVSSTGLIVHVTVWNKYSKAVLDFNVPLSGFDVAFWRMKDILNGHLNVNQWLQSGTPNDDVCGYNGVTYSPVTGFGQTTFIRFINPSSADANVSISIYADPAFTGTFRTRVWDSLDETRDITGLVPTPLGVIDTDNPACSATGASDGAFSGDFGGYLTLDVVNYCTNWFPDQSQFYTNDAIATAGWGYYGYTPNALIGDIFYVDPATTGGNVSGDPMVPLEYDYRLNNWVLNNTFFGRYYVAITDTALTPLTNGNTVTNYSFNGDGREPLGSNYGFRYLSDAANGLTSWAIVWRSDNYNSASNSGVFNQVNLCSWWGTSGTRAGWGFYDQTHVIAASTYDNDENVAITSGGPSGGPTASQQYIFLESQRISLAGNADINPAGFKSGWINLNLPGHVSGGIKGYQAYVGVQHSGPGLAISVGYSAANLSGDWNCSPAANVMGATASVSNPF